MAFDTFMVYVGVYPDVDSAGADYELVKDLHYQAGLIDAYDAAVIQRRADNKVKIVRKHETPTRVGGVLGGGFGLATGLVVALFPFAAIGGGLLAATTAGGAVLGAVAGLALCGVGLTDGWWVLWLGLAGVVLDRLARLRPGRGDDGWIPDVVGGFDFGGDAGCGGGGGD